MLSCSGTFFAELMQLAGFTFDGGIVILGLSGKQLLVKLLSAGIALVFVVINVRVLLEDGESREYYHGLQNRSPRPALFFGIKAMLSIPDWGNNFLSDPSPLPHGAGGVILAMGLTFVAFEGYEIIAQSGGRS